MGKNNIIKGFNELLEKWCIQRIQRIQHRDSDPKTKENVYKLTPLICAVPKYTLFWSKMAKSSRSFVPAPY